MYVRREKTTLRTRREICKPKERPRKKPNLPTPCSQTSGLQNCEKKNVCCLSHRVCGILLRQLKQTNTLPFSKSCTCHVCRFLYYFPEPGSCPPRLRAPRTQCYLHESKRKREKLAGQTYKTERAQRCLLVKISKPKLHKLRSLEN